MNESDAPLGFAGHNWILRFWTKRLLRPLPALLAAVALLASGCGSAKYCKLRVHVVDEHTQAGIQKAKVRTFYIKPMLDPSFQRHDSAKTDKEGFAVLTVATNWSQKTIFGWTHGIFPVISAEAPGYNPGRIGVSREALERGDSFLISMIKANGATNAFSPSSVIAANEQSRKMITERNDLGGTNTYVQVTADKGQFEFKSLDANGKVLQWTQAFADQEGRVLIDVIRKTLGHDEVQAYEGVQYIHHHTYREDGKRATTVEFFGDGRIRRKIIYRYNDEGTLLGGDVYREGKRVGWIHGELSTSPEDSKK